LNQRFHYIATALENVPDDTVIDGELVAVGPDGRPGFNLLQNFRSAESRIIYYAFDILIHRQRNLKSSTIGAAGHLEQRHRNV
jgi:bifunctional non-homologous end joining protein LigD